MAYPSHASAITQFISAHPIPIIPFLSGKWRENSFKAIFESLYFKWALFFFPYLMSVRSSETVPAHIPLAITSNGLTETLSP
jgi:hypothetical protein